MTPRPAGSTGAGRWVRRPGPTRPRCSSPRARRTTATPGWSAGTPPWCSPSLKPGERLVETAIKPERGDILGADDKPIVTPATRAPGRHRQEHARGRRGEAFRELARPARGRRRQGFRQAGHCRRPEGVRAGDRLPAQRRTPHRARRSQRHQGSAGDLRPAAARPHQGLRVRDPRHGRTGDCRAGQGQRRTHQGRGRRRALRPAEEVRRAARRHPGSDGRGRRRGG